METHTVTLLALAAIVSSPLFAEPSTTPNPNPPTGPWAVASGAEWSGDYPKFNPLLRDAGVRFLRYFPEWHTIQPAKGEWNWEPADKFVADAKKNNIQITGVWAYFSKWASADGGMRKGPVKDIQYWRDYTRETAARYKNDIRNWEIWNEFNGSFYQGIDKVKEYAALTVAAYEEVKKVDPGIKVGISVANFDVGFLDATIKAGAAGHFDFVAVHPYENAGTLANGGEYGYLSLAGSLRKMLADNKQSDDVELWITETGYQSKIEPDAEADALQASQLVKIYILSIVQGFSKVAWFEARGPAYGKDTDHGLIRRDWTLRPAYRALKEMTALLGENPEYVGWIDRGSSGSSPDEHFYGFVFMNGAKPVLVSWTPTTAPKFTQNIAAAAVATARANKSKPFPWGKDYSKVSEAKVRLGGVNINDGIQQFKPSTTSVVNDLVESWRRTDFATGGEGRYVYFRTDPTFAGFGNKELEITVVAKRADTKKPAGMSLTYESLNGYRGAPGGWWTPPASEGWHEKTWKVTDANFVGAWGWNFRTDSVGSPAEIDIKEVRVKKVR